MFIVKLSLKGRSFFQECSSGDLLEITTSNQLLFLAFAFYAAWQWGFFMIFQNYKRLLKQGKRWLPLKFAVLILVRGVLQFL